MIGREIENFLTKHDNVSLTGEEELFDVLEGEIADTSFIPSEVLDVCRNGFRWLAKTSNTGKFMTSSKDWISFEPLSGYIMRPYISQIKETAHIVRLAYYTGYYAMP